MDIKTLQKNYTLFLEEEIKGRQITLSDIEPIIEQLPSSLFQKTILGTSEENRTIYKIKIGTGENRILIWSQMHGNESTGTKALFDLFRFFQGNHIYSKVVDEMLQTCTICIIPILNPDGSVRFTRENANGIDLNRDAVDLKAIESQLLRKALNEFNPHYCFNLHDQRSIFNVENTPNPATISFLAPSEDENRTLTEGRKKTMSVIVAMNKALQRCVPNHIGRYTDEFYPTATGDNFQKLGHHTILIEAGHYKNDYEREKTRELNFYALAIGIYHIATQKGKIDYLPYFDIPNNDKKFLDIIYNNVKVNGKNVSVGIQYKFKMEQNKLVKYPHIEVIGNLSSYYTNTQINAKGEKIEKLNLKNS
ncbi:MAG: zinc carboxypeptidase [Flavobacteriaceae bacterium]|nr:zinc carboxypeptidase [Flavobacteriaceae bacterium]